MAAALIELHSACYKIWQLGQSKFGAAATSAQVRGRLQEQLRPIYILCGRLGTVFSHQWLLQFYNHKVFHWSYWSLTVTTFAIPSYGMYYQSLCIYIHTEIHRYSTWTHWQAVYLWHTTESIHINSIYHIHTLTFPAFRFMHSCWGFLGLHYLCGSSWPGMQSYHFTLILSSSSWYLWSSANTIGYHARRSGVFMMDCLPSSSSISPNRNRGNLEIHSKIVIEQVWRYSSRSWSYVLWGVLEGGDGANFEAVMERVWRYTWKPWVSEYGDRNWASLEMHSEARIEQVLRYTWRPWWRECADHNPASLVMHFESVIEQV